jgi:hypothetical protein
VKCGPFELKRKHERRPPAQPHNHTTTNPTSGLRTAAFASSASPPTRHARCSHPTTRAQRAFPPRASERCNTSAPPASSWLATTISPSHHQPPRSALVSAAQTRKFPHAHTYTHAPRLCRRAIPSPNNSSRAHNTSDGGRRLPLRTSLKPRRLLRARSPDAADEREGAR